MLSVNHKKKKNSPLLSVMLVQFMHEHPGPHCLLGLKQRHRLFPHCVFSHLQPFNKKLTRSSTAFMFSSESQSGILYHCSSSRICQLVVE